MPKTANSAFGLLNKLGLLVAKNQYRPLGPCVYRPQDHFYQISGLKVKNYGYLYIGNWNPVYPSVNALLKKGRPLLRSGLEKLLLRSDAICCRKKGA